MRLSTLIERLRAAEVAYGDVSLATKEGFITWTYLIAQRDKSLDSVPLSVKPNVLRLEFNISDGKPHDD